MIWIDIETRIDDWLLSDNFQPNVELDQKLKEWVKEKTEHLPVKDLYHLCTCDIIDEVDKKNPLYDRLRKKLQWHGLDLGMTTEAANGYYALFLPDSRWGQRAWDLALALIQGGQYGGCFEDAFREAQSMTMWYIRNCTRLTWRKQYE